MAKPKDTLETYRQENRYLKRIIVLFLIALFFIGVTIWRIPEQLVVYTAPDITKQFSQKAGSVPSSTVYSYARVLWETINYCEEDCSIEYPEKINKYKNYITKACRNDLLNHFKTNKQLYNYRSRMLLPTENTLFSNEKLKKVSDDIWYVKLEYVLKDDVRGMETRNNLMYYPIKVVRSTKPISINQYQLEIDCYFGDGPSLIENRKNTGA